MFCFVFLESTIDFASSIGLIWFREQGRISSVELLRQEQNRRRFSLGSNQRNKTKIGRLVLSLLSFSFSETFSLFPQVEIFSSLFSPSERFASTRYKQSVHEQQKHFRIELARSAQVQMSNMILSPMTTFFLIVVIFQTILAANLPYSESVRSPTNSMTRTSDDGFSDFDFSSMARLQQNDEKSDEDDEPFFKRNKYTNFHLSPLWLSRRTRTNRIYGKPLWISRPG